MIIIKYLKIYNNYSYTSEISISNSLPFAINIAINITIVVETLVNEVYIYIYIFNILKLNNINYV